MSRNLKDKFNGCLLGGAIGDALGYPVEFMSQAVIKRKYGTEGVKDFPATLYHTDKAVVSDDTQMTLFTANGLIWAWHRIKERGIGDWIGSGIYPAYLRWLATQGYYSDRIPTHFLRTQSFEDNPIMNQKELYASRAPGITCLSALSSGACGDVCTPINNSKGCGAVMRVAPVGLFFYDDPETAFNVGVRSAAVTHGHPTAQLAAGACAELIARIVSGQKIGVAVVDIMKHIKRRKAGTELYNALNMSMESATVGIEPNTAIPNIGGGWTAEEALGIAVYCAVYADTPNDALLMAVNHGGDSDSTGAVCGNLVGAMYGMNALRIKWITDVELSGYIRYTADELLKATHDRRNTKNE